MGRSGGAPSISLEETCTKLRDEVRVLEVCVRKDSYRCLRLPIRQAWLYPLRLLVRYARPAQLSLEGRLGGSALGCLEGVVRNSAGDEELRVLIQRRREAHQVAPLRRLPYVPHAQVLLRDAAEAPRGLQRLAHGRWRAATRCLHAGFTHRIADLDLPGTAGVRAIALVHRCGIGAHVGRGHCNRLCERSD